MGMLVAVWGAWMLWQGMRDGVGQVSLRAASVRPGGDGPGGARRVHQLCRPQGGYSVQHALRRPGDARPRHLRNLEDEV